MSELTEQNRELVTQIYAAFRESDQNAVGALLDEHLHVQPPPFLPWGGPYESRQEWSEHCIPKLTEVYDLRDLEVRQLVADENTVVSLILITVKNADRSKVLHQETWTLQDGKAIAMQTFCFDPRPVQNLLNEQRNP